MGQGSSGGGQGCCTSSTSNSRPSHTVARAAPTVEAMNRTLCHFASLGLYRACSTLGLPPTKPVATGSDSSSAA